MYKYKDAHTCSMNTGRYFANFSTHIFWRRPPRTSASVENVTTVIVHASGSSNVSIHLSTSSPSSSSFLIVLIIKRYAWRTYFEACFLNRTNFSSICNKPWVVWVCRRTQGSSWEKESRKTWLIFFEGTKPRHVVVVRGFPPSAATTLSPERENNTERDCKRYIRMNWLWCVRIWLVEADWAQLMQKSMWRIRVCRRDDMEHRYIPLFWGLMCHMPFWEWPHRCFVFVV